LLNHEWTNERVGMLPPSREETLVCDLGVAALHRGPLIKSHAEDLSGHSVREIITKRKEIVMVDDHHRSWCLMVFWHQLGTVRGPEDSSSGAGLNKPVESAVQVRF